ncbi:uncharacterized protein LOC127716434 [Mytilus californianus]|uniref:uncharacterized protein LOC127716434 n=1 Tax=Mytilus californianus TaxID=6549 RepID=UPI002246399C|nr:uncharacterized protein LOC127716434 [Mytilus californianus]XP_052078583.1 uncharacterized protein LOC127716434 [Mytilus californianus]XP_052078584.1 uncharacterized protein LOC127716434 [Mytilus californianus]
MRIKMGNSSSKNNVKSLNQKKIKSHEKEDQVGKRSSVSILSTEQTSQCLLPGDVQIFGNSTVLPLSEYSSNVQGRMYNKRIDESTNQRRPQTSLSQLSVDSQESSVFSGSFQRKNEYDQLDSGHDNVSESKRLLNSTVGNSGFEKINKIESKKKKKKKHLRKTVDPQTEPEKWADRKNITPRKSGHFEKEHDTRELTHEMDDFDLKDVRKQLASVETGKKVADFQIKVMTIKAERLAKVCKGDSEMSSLDKDNTDICPKDFLQSISYVEKYTIDQKSKMQLLEREKQSYLNRLSSLAGAMLSDDNPNITDLNDPKRPTKLAEQLCSIYDNDWTDAMEMLEQSLPNTEENKEKCAHHLYCVIKVIYQTCKLKADVQLQGITEHYFLLNSPSLDQIKGWWLNYPSERKKIIEGRKLTAMGVIKQLQETLKDDPVFLQQRNDCYPKLDLDMFDVLLATSYFNKCIAICWNLVIQDPPMYLETVKLEGKLLDKEHYKEYTKSGTKIKYIVWPALYLFCNDKKGPLMAKGVVQVN